MTRQSLRELYLTSIRQLCVNYDPASKESFSSYLSRNYQTAKHDIKQEPAQHPSESDLIALRNALFIFAVGVFINGDLSAAEDIINNVPSSGEIKRLAGALKVFLPLPDEIDPKNSPELFHQWLRDNKKFIKWNDNEGLYEIGK